LVRDAVSARRLNSTAPGIFATTVKQTPLFAALSPISNCDARGLATLRRQKPQGDLDISSTSPTVSMIPVNTKTIINLLAELE
jgi:hypothetical protein